jgi:hypothetical protein
MRFAECDMSEGHNCVPADIESIFQREDSWMVKGEISPQNPENVDAR